MTLHERVEEIRKLAFELTPEGQYRLAFLVAENVGYVLEREPDHPDSPHATPPSDVTVRVEEIARIINPVAFDCVSPAMYGLETQEQLEGKTAVGSIRSVAREKATAILSRLSGKGPT